MPIEEPGGPDFSQWRIARKSTSRLRKSPKAA
jgi:hypothetical protein